MDSSQRGSRILKTLVILLICAACFAAGVWVSGLLKAPEEKMISAAYRKIAGESIFNDKGQRELAYAAIRGMLGSVEDPYGELIEPQAAQNFTNTFAGQTGVVGLYAENQDGKVVITIVFPGSAAEEAGLKLGDVILAVDDTTLDSASDSSETGLLMRGRAGEVVHLKTQRGTKIIEYDLVRKVRQFVTSRMLAEGIGYLSLSAFNDTATGQMKEALADLLTHNPVGLIWDLRANEGGDMLAAQNVLSFFIEEGLLFSAEQTYNRIVQFSAKGKPVAPDIPLVVLIDQTSYSAAETCAAAIMERGRGRTVGSNSYGKGLIQSTTPLGEDVLLQLTIAKWYSPQGIWFQDVGVTPEVVMLDDPATDADEVLDKAVELLASQK